MKLTPIFSNYWYCNHRAVGLGLLQMISYTLLVVTHAQSQEDSKYFMDAKPDQFPWIVSFKSVSRCMGTLIKPLWVVTAAHCLEGNPNPSEYKFQLGPIDSKHANVPTRDAAELHVFPDYKSSQKTRIRDYANNIALIKLKTPFENAETLEIRSIPFPRDKTQKMLCVILGLVKELNQDKDNDFKVLQYSHVFGKMFEFCVEINDKNRFTMRNTLCALKPKDHGVLCGGDPGSPLVCWMKNSRWATEGEMELVGVSSWNRDGVFCGGISTYTDAGRFSSWIQYTINKAVLDRSELHNRFVEEKLFATGACNGSSLATENQAHKPNRNIILNVFCTLIFLLTKIM